jgi:hypothetical protein
MSVERRPNLERNDEEEAATFSRVPAVVDACGNKLVTLLDDQGRLQTRRVADLVLEAFVGPCPPGHELRFKDGDPLNCDLANLEWVKATSAEHPPVSGPAKLRDVQVDPQGRLIAENGEQVVMPGLGTEDVLKGLAEAESGRARSLREILAGRRG